MNRENDQFPVTNIQRMTNDQCPMTKKKQQEPAEVPGEGMTNDRP
jgi:hypothetical protein